MNKKVLAYAIVTTVLILTLSACGAVGPAESEGIHSRIESTQEQKESTYGQVENLVESLGSSEAESTVSENDRVEGETQESTLMEQLMSAEVASPEDFLYADLDDGTLHIVEYLGSSDIVVVPGEIEGKQVSTIDSYVFAQDCGVRAVKLPDSVRVIEDYAFGLNPTLEIVICGNGVEEIGTGSFMQCDNLQYVDIGNSVTKIGECAFVLNPKLTDIYLPESVEDIDYSAFENDSNSAFLLRGVSGSYAEEYAAWIGIPFVEG